MAPRNLNYYLNRMLIKLPILPLKQQNRYMMLPIEIFFASRVCQRHKLMHMVLQYALG